MASTPRFNVAFRRKRQGLTDYRTRLELLKSRKPRLVIRRALANMIAQIVEYQPDGDKVLVSVSSNHLKKHGLTVVNGNIPVSYLTGILLAKEAQAHKIKEVTVDLGLQKLTEKSRLYGLIKGAIEGGLVINADEKVFPQDERVNGKHIETYAQKIKSDDAAYKRQFGAYIKQNVDPASISQLYAKVKASILK